MLWGPPEHVQFISKEILDGLIWILLPQYLHYHNIFSENLRKVDVRKRRKEVKETPHRRRRTRWCLPPENKQYVKPEPVCIVQSDLSEQGSGIVSLSVTNLAEILCLLARLRFRWQVHELLHWEIQEKLKSKSSSRRLFATLIPPTCKLFFNSGTFILTKLGSISLLRLF